MFHNEWEIKESGILALGAIAEGKLSLATIHNLDLGQFGNSILYSRDP